MSILHELRSLAGGGQNTVPSCRTIALLCINPAVKSSALQQFPRAGISVYFIYV